MMAALVGRHPKFLRSLIMMKNIDSVGYATKAEKKKGIDRKRPPIIVSTAESIAAKGFLRPQKSYTPPDNVDAKLDELFVEVLGEKSGDTPISNLTKRFDLFTQCAQTFNHPIPNSLLHTIETLQDVKLFYKTPISTKTPLDTLKTMELPKNLHIQYDYHRFHPDGDKNFGGQTAFNRSSTLVTGLKYKDKYKGHIQAQTWPYNS